MAVNLERVIENLRHLPPEQQEEVASFIEELFERLEPHPNLWDRIEERVAQVPEEVWEEIPTDGAEQHDHYLYGSPKR